jgi:anti-sigma regulatory factor (Ser/Thr protein kinase)
MIVLRLNSDASAPSIARTAVRDALAARSAELRDIAVLLANEIVTNALVHSPGDIELTVEDSTETIRIEVWDTSSSSPLVRSPNPRGERGRGMLIVEALASSWGVVQRPMGKSVWFSLNVAQGA